MSTDGIIAAAVRKWMASYEGYPTHILELDQIEFSLFLREGNMHRVGHHQ